MAARRKMVLGCILGVLICSSNLFTVSQGVWLNLPPTGTKCVSEEIHNNVVVLSDYVVVSDDHSHIPTISVKVTSPYGNTLHQTENVTHGQFAFTTHEAGNYLACFWVDGHVQGDVSVNIDWKTGIAAKDWDSVARKEKIEGVELELRKLEGAVEAIHENLLYLKTREAEMRSVSETTNTRVALFSVMSLGVCIAVSALQVWHLKHYLQKKKLI
ncbi:PREDICTED: transmembrane emp24 domain-containing protein p24delta3-like [Populus euphratica]|uniref:Transmembrane emp24 domain-containing protein p24delta3-like n=1 Tax=Populus euphratica TaxID=75702 RepID=A0AAJ6X5W0_POPEU|nr:PREDICTED: transmembrane emp24 domain-containing protein p24delta3-like [Populus euphratica]XP_011006529.1 PREDICTED: transmembrane emp24 domain-containing protein p24delta3-like [Populus euphratica]